MEYIPYKTENLFTGVRTPAPVKNNSAAYAFWQRALYQRLCSTVEFTLPESWERARDFFELALFVRGFVGVFDTKKFGVSFQPGTLSGYDFYYQPTKLIVSNPAYHATLKIGSETELIKLTNDFRGVWDIVNYYAEKLATIDGAVNMSIINSKFAYVFGAKNKAGARAIEMIFDKINKGEPTIVFDKQIVNGLGDNEPFEFIDRAALKNSYITTDLLNDAQTLLNSFDSEIGIPTIPAEKRERMITDEANSRVADSSARITLWDECLRTSIEKVNDRFDLDISFKFKYLNDDQETENDKKGVNDIWGLQS